MSHLNFVFEELAGSMYMGGIEPCHPGCEGKVQRNMLVDRSQEVQVLLLTVTAAKVTFGQLQLLLAFSYGMRDGIVSSWCKPLEF